MSTIARPWRTALWLAVSYVALLIIVAFVPGGSRASDVVSGLSTAAPTPRGADCVVCGIDKQCDPSTGMCVFVDHTPLPCIKGAKFDDNAGFCLPTAESVQPAPVATAGELPGVPITPREPSNFGLPGMENDRGDSSTTTQTVQEPKATDAPDRHQRKQDQNDGGITKN